jgi:hypothetical protein
MIDREQTAPAAESGPFSYTLLTDPGVRKQLFLDAQALVDKIFASSRKKHPDVMFFLDRSARPSAWLFQEAWKQTRPDVPMPDIKFINIGKEKADPNFLGKYASPGEQQRFIDRWRNHPFVQELRKFFPQEINGKKIWVVDEYEQEGVSVMIAKVLLEAAFLERGGNIISCYMHKNEPPWLWKESWIGVHENKPGDLLVSPLPYGVGIDTAMKNIRGTAKIERVFHPDQSKQLRKEIRALVKENILT